MFILLTWCEFQKYALTSLQQLLADHPPAPEGLDPDIGTVVNKHLCLFCFFVCLFVVSSLFFFFCGGGGGGDNERCAKRGGKLSNTQFGNNTQLV